MITDFRKDYDLRACLENNPQDFTVGEIVRVIAVIEGENDEREWWWLLELTDNRVALLVGGCDYTGWDCRSHADSVICDSADDPLLWLHCAQTACDTFAAHHAEECAREYWYIRNSLEYHVPQNVVDELTRQEEQGRAMTRREIVGNDLFGEV